MCVLLYVNSIPFFFLLWNFGIFDSLISIHPHIHIHSAYAVGSQVVFFFLLRFWFVLFLCNLFGHAVTYALTYLLFGVLSFSISIKFNRSNNVFARSVWAFGFEHFGPFSGLFALVGSIFS